MNRTLVIARRELSSYFYSPIAYVAMFVFLIACAGNFWDDFKPGQPALMRHLFESMIWILVLIVPLLCMGLLAQEWASGTIETMMTAPVGETDMVLGKFLGSLGFFVVLLLPTVLFAILLRIYGRPDLGPILSGYIGTLLVGALFIAVGLFCSSLTRSQVVAAVSTVAVLCLITVLPYYADAKASLPEFWRKVCQQAVFNRYSDFTKGIIDTGDVIFFIAASAVFLFITVKVLESRRWK